MPDVEVIELSLEQGRLMLEREAARELGLTPADFYYRLLRNDWTDLPHSWADGCVVDGVLMLLPFAGIHHD